MSYEELVKLIEDNEYEDIIILEHPSYSDAFIGISNDNRAIYDYEKMIDYLVKNYDMSYMDAVDFISYDTERSLNYLSYTHNNTPIILYKLL